MSKILELYKEMLESEQRFIDETFQDEIYQAACPKLTIIDAGAYEGEFSFYCLNFAKKIYAFEPDPRPWEILKSRVERFDLGNKIEIFNKALTGETGNRVFGATGYGGSRVLERSARAKKSENRLKTPTVSLYDFIKEKGIEQIDILKIDIEDGEKEVFGTKEFPELSKKIKVIIGEHLGAVDGLLGELGYKATPVEGGNTLYEQTQTNN